MNELTGSTAARSSTTPGATADFTLVSILKAQDAIGLSDGKAVAAVEKQAQRQPDRRESSGAKGAAHGRQRRIGQQHHQLPGGAGKSELLAVLQVASEMDPSSLGGGAAGGGRTATAPADASDMNDDSAGRIYEMELRDHSAENLFDVDSPSSKERRRPRNNVRRRCHSDGDQAEEIFKLADGGGIGGGMGGGFGGGAAHGGGFEATMDDAMMEPAVNFEGGDFGARRSGRRGEGIASPSANSCPDIYVPENLLQGDVYEMDLNDAPPRRPSSRARGGGGGGGGGGAVLSTSPGGRPYKRRYSDGDTAERIYAAAYASEGRGGGAGGFTGGDEAMMMALGAGPGHGTFNDEAAAGPGGMGGLMRSSSPASCPDMHGLEERLAAADGGARMMPPGVGPDAFGAQAAAGPGGLGGRMRSSSPASCPDIHGLEERLAMLDDGDVYEMDLNDVGERNQQQRPQKSRYGRRNRGAGGGGGNLKTATFQRRHSDGDRAEKIFAAAGGLGFGGLQEEPVQQDDAFPSASSVDEVHQRLFSSSRKLGRASSMPYPHLAGFSLGATSQATAASRAQLQMQFASAFGVSGGSQQLKAETPPPPSFIDTSVPYQSPSALKATVGASATSSSSSLMSAPEPPLSAGSMGKRSSMGSIGAVKAQRRSSALGSKKEVTVVKAGRSARRPSQTATQAALGIGVGMGGRMVVPPALVTSSLDAASAIGPDKTPSPAVAAGSGTSTSDKTPTTKKRGWKKPKDKPKRPLSAYNLFFQAERNRIIGASSEQQTAEEKEKQRARRRAHRKTHGKIGFAALAQTIAAKWRELEPAERAPFESRAGVEKARYKKELEAWKLAQKEKEQKQKQQDKAEADQKQQQEQQQQQQVAAAAVSASATSSSSSLGVDMPPAPPIGHDSSGDLAAAVVQANAAVGQHVPPPQAAPQAVAAAAAAATRQHLPPPQAAQQAVVAALEPMWVGSHSYNQMHRNLGTSMTPPFAQPSSPGASAMSHGAGGGGAFAAGESLDMGGEPKGPPRGAEEEVDDPHANDEDLFLGPITDDFWASPLEENGLMTKNGGAVDMDAMFSGQPQDGTEMAADVVMGKDNPHTLDLSASGFSSLDNGHEGK